MSERPNLFDMGVDIDININDGVTRPGSSPPSLPLLRTVVYVILIRMQKDVAGADDGNGLSAWGAGEEHCSAARWSGKSKLPLIPWNSRRTCACGRIVVQRSRPITVVESDTGPHGYGLSGRVVQRHFATARCDSRLSGRAWNGLYRNAGS